MTEDTSGSPVGLSDRVDDRSGLLDGQAAFAARLRERAAQLGINQAGLVKATGIPKQSIAGYWGGSQVIGADRLFKVSDTLDVDARWLLTGEERALGEGLRSNLRKALAANAASAEAGDLVELQEIDLAYGLGGTYSDGPVEVETHRFPRAWLAKITTTPASQLTIARGRGDSMQPTLQDGDMVLIDRSQRTVREQDAVWALTLGDIAMIKRIRARGERVTILSDNDRVPPDEVHHEEVNIVGRVIFIGRRV